MDQEPQHLPGAWVARVDEKCRTVSCTFSLARPPSQLVEIGHSESAGSFSQGYGSTPKEALDEAIQEHAEVRQSGAPATECQ